MAIMTSSPAATVRELFRRFDALDFEGLGALATDDMEAIDEGSRHWLRGRADLKAYMAQLDGVMKYIRSEVKDIHETIYGDVGIVTCWLEQDYTMGGQRQHVSAPTTAVLRRLDGDWKLALFHSIPLPPAS